MSEIDNTSFRAKYNQTITAADVNEKFTDVATASGTINEDNIGAEGIGRLQLNGYALKTWATIDNNARNTGTTYSFNTDASRGALERSQTQLTHIGSLGQYEFNFSGGPITVNVGDVIRLNAVFTYQEAENGNLTGSTGAVPTTGYPNFNDQDYRGCFLINSAFLSAAYDPLSSFWTPWPINTSNNFVNWMTYFEQKGPEFNGGVPPEPDRYTIPIGDNPISGYDSGIAIISYDGDFDSPKTVHESQVHLNLNLVCKKQITLYKVGFFIQGPLLLISQVGSRNRGFEAANSPAMASDGDAIRIKMSNFHSTLMIFENGDYT
jgi:hypothetical protein